MRKLKVETTAERVVWTCINTDAAEDAARLINLILGEESWLRHQRASWAGLCAATARDTRRLVKAHIKRRGDEGVESGAHEVVAGGANHFGTDVGATTTVNAARRFAQDEGV